MTHKISNISKKILCFGLPLIFLYLIYFIVVINSHANTSKDVLIHIYSPQIEYVIMSFTILMISSLLFDITEKELKLMNK